MRERLVGQPMYVRGAWQENNLAFDGAGKPLKELRGGALTLSGIDVRDVSIQKKRLLIVGDRVALVADATGTLQRKTPMSSTSIAFSMMPKDKRVFHAKEEMKITIDADASGSFEPALKAVFANGLAELATSVPPYWRCYAEGYFTQRLAAVEAKKVVQDCVLRTDLSEVKEGDRIEGDYIPPRLIGSERPMFPPEASELGIRGVTQLHCTVTRKGVSVGFQVVQALGAGVEESLLTYLYKAQFEPGMKDDFPVNADYEATYTFETVEHP